MVAEYATLTVILLMMIAELFHARRCRRLAQLAFGPQGRAARWVGVTPLLRVVACGLLTWGLMTLLLIDPKIHSIIADDDQPRPKHLLLVVDVSPSMFLKDGGSEKNQPRRARAAEVLTSLFNRLPMSEYNVSLIAFYNGAKPLLEESTDPEVIHHIVEKLPIYIGFKPGKTDLFAGLELAGKMSKKWKPHSTTMVVVTDGVTIPKSGMPQMPPSIKSTLLIGVGDPYAGQFIDGHQSRQDVSNLRQIAARMQGIYHDCNSSHIPSTTIEWFSADSQSSDWRDWSRREWALLAIAIGSIGLGLLPLALHLLGNPWKAGVKQAIKTPLGATQMTFPFENQRITETR